MMNHLTNIFSVLKRDAEDDKEQAESSAPAKGRKDGFNSDESSKKVEESEKRSGNDNGKVETQVLREMSRDFRNPLVWIDLEMTGLDVEVDRILEIACIVTDGKLLKVVEGPDLVIHQSKECLDNMGEWCQNHHAASGLTKRVLQSTVTEKEAEKEVMEFVKKYIDTDHKPLLAGNSVYVDLQFLKKYMPDLADLFSHVVVDVSSVKALCIRWYPADRKRAPQKSNKHRAMDDIKESIMELKYFKQTIFKATK
ncbi:oligoribonuclease-like [Aristolochia californica]|uniref:oligoribonuclease-like n=1 Tax=Aristolochia californica TaxID=171875 RepID=UPI0035DA0EF4